MAAALPINPPPFPVAPVLADPSPIVQQAAHIINGDLQEQGDINRMLGNMAVQQQEQRQGDIALAKQIIAYFDHQVRQHRQELNGLAGRAAQNGVDAQEARRQYNELQPKVAAAEAILNNLDQAVKLPGGIVALANRIKCFEDDKEQRDREISEAINRIRTHLTGLKKKQNDKYDDGMESSLLFSGVLFVLSTWGTLFLGPGGTIALSTLIKSYLAVNFLPAPFWIKALFHNIKKEHHEDILKKFEDNLKKGISPEVALQLARN